jgi:nicotinate-nucleotide adenylyltransferase
MPMTNEGKSSAEKQGRARKILRKRTDWVRAPGPVERGLRIGLLGGSFNPPHEGHVHVSDAALKKLHLDYVWWLVSPQNPLKPVKGMASFDKRLDAARKLAGARPRMIATGIEQVLGTRFTIDTLRALKRRFPQAKFVWLMGSDNLVQIPRWRRWQDIFAEVPVAVVTRPGSALAARCSKAAGRFKSSGLPADARFADAKPPALTVIEVKRNAASGTRLRAASASRK